MTNIFAFGLRVHQNIFLKIPLFGPFLGVGLFNEPRNFICTKLNRLVPRLLHTKYQCIRAIGFVRGIFFLYPKFPLLCSLLICTHFNLHSPMMLPTKFGSNQFNGFGE